MAEDTKANVFSLEASISINVTNFEKNIKKIKKSGIELQQIMAKSTKSVEKMQRFLNGFDTTKFKRSVKGIGDGLDDIGDSAEESSDSVDDIGDSAEDSAKKSKTAFGKLKDSVKATFNEMDDHFKMTSDSLQSSISKTATSFGKITAAVEKIIDAIKKIGEVAVKSFKIAVEAGEKFTESIVDVIDKANDIENKISLVFGGAGLVVGGASFAVGKDFEASMANVMAVMGINKETVNKEGKNIYDMLENAAKEAGATTMFTAKDAADALGYLAQSGYRENAMIEMLPTVLKLAKAGGMDLAYTAQQLAIFMNLMEDNDITAEKLSDMLVKTANNSSTSVQELMEAFSIAAGQANAVGITMYELLPFLGVLANANYRGHQGGTIARNVLSDLYTPTDKADVLLENYGLSYKYDNGKLKELRVYLNELFDVVDSIDEVDRVVLLGDIFDTRNLSGARAAITKGETWEKLTREIDNCAGATDRMGKTYSDTVTGDMVSMTSRLQSVGLAIYEYIKNPIRDAVQEATGYLTKLQQSIDEHGISVGAFHIGDMVDESLEKNTPSITGFMDEAEVIVRRFVQGFADNIPNISENISEIIKKFGEVRDEIFNSIFEVFRKDENSTGLINIGTTILDTMLTTAENVTGTLAENLPQFIDKIADSLSENKDSWTKSITAIIKNISDLIVKSAPALVEIGGTLLVAIVQGMATTTTEITKILPSILDEFTKLLSDKEFSESLKQSFKQIIGDIGDIIVMLVKFIAEPNNLQFILDIIGNILNEITNTLDEITPELMAALEPIGEKIGTFLNEKLLPFIATIHGIGVSIGSAFIKGLYSGVANSKFMGVFPSLNKIFSGLFLSGPRGIKDAVSKSGKANTSEIIDKINNTSPPIDAYISEDMPITDFVRREYNPLANYSKEFAYRLNTGVENLAIKSTTGDNGGFMQGLNTSMSNLVSNMDFSWASDIGYNLVTNIVNGISTAWEEFKTKVSEIFSFLDFSDEIESAKKWGGDFIMNLSSSAIQKWDNWKGSIAKIFDFFDLSELANKAYGWGSDMISNLAKGIEDMTGRVGIAMGGVVGAAASFINNSASTESSSQDAEIWGSDLINNFAEGIKKNSGILGGAIDEAATQIKKWIGFSEPEEGPLSNFHTFAPDMIDLFASGIRNNANQIYSEVNNIADGIKSGFTGIGVSQPLNYEIDDIGKYISDNISSVPVAKNNSQSVTIQNLTINVEGTNIESDYDVDRMVDRMSDRAIETISGRMKMLGIFSERALGGTAW